MPQSNPAVTPATSLGRHLIRALEAIQLEHGVTVEKQVAQDDPISPERGVN
jgi:hypothetical protein